MAQEFYIDENGNKIPISGTVNSADMMPMSASDPTKVKTAIDAKADSSDIPTWIKQASGTSSGTIGGASVFGYYYADQWTAYIYLPFIAKNTNYTVNINAVSADNVGDVTSKCSVVAKQNGYFTIRTTKTMPNLPDYYSVCPLRITYSIDFA